MKKVTRLIMTIGIMIALVMGFYYISKTVSAVTGKSIIGWVGKIFKLSFCLK